jgi:hypothetical protein
MAKLLVAYGADVKKQDLTGGTALHWAVQNNNIPLTQFLLENGADANAYTKYAQPVLVEPVLRRQQDLKELLYQHGADLKFAQDYINIKLIGHRFELVGRVDIVDAKGKFIEMDFEGFVIEFTVAVVQDSLVQFRNNFSARNLRSHFADFEKIIEAFNVAAELVRYQQYMTDIAQHKHRIDKLAKRELLLLPVGYEGHAITFIRYKNLFAKCDRGENSLRNPSVQIYKITRPRAFNQAFVKMLMYKKHNKYFVTQGVVEALGLQPLTDLPMSSQLAGNCSWANMEASIPTMLLMFWLEHNSVHSVADMQRHKDIALAIYKQWLEWDKDWALHQCVESFYDASPARKASKAAMLAAVLFQTCNYAVPQDLDRANKILAVLSDHNYRYVIDSYSKVYANTEVGRNLAELIDLYGK